MDLTSLTNLVNYPKTSESITDKYLQEFSQVEIRRQNQRTECHRLSIFSTELIIKGCKSLYSILQVKAVSIQEL